MSRERVLIDKARLARERDHAELIDKMNKYSKMNEFERKQSRKERNRI